VKIKLFGVVAVAGILSLGALAYAQDETALVKVPFPFVASGTVLPAGNYRVVLDGGDLNMTMLYNANGNGGIGILSGLSTHVSAKDRATFSFEKVDGYYFLARISVPGFYDRVVPLSMRTMTTEVAKLQAAGDHALGGTQH
jgi:hypothetical protein